MIWIYGYSAEQLLLMDHSQENMSIFQLHSLAPVWATYKKSEQSLKQKKYFSSQKVFFVLFCDPGFKRRW